MAGRDHPSTVVPLAEICGPIPAGRSVDDIEVSATVGVSRDTNLTVHCERACAEANSEQVEDLTFEDIWELGDYDCCSVCVPDDVYDVWTLFSSWQNLRRREVTPDRTDRDRWALAAQWADIRIRMGLYGPAAAPVVRQAVSQERHGTAPDAAQLAEQAGAALSGTDAVAVLWREAVAGEALSGWEALIVGAATRRIDTPQTTVVVCDAGVVGALHAGRRHTNGFAVLDGAGFGPLELRLLATLVSALADTAGWAALTSGAWQQLADEAASVAQAV